MKPILVFSIAYAAVAGAWDAPVAAAEPVVLEQIVSRHDPHFKIASARMTVGRDGNIYLGNGGPDGGYVLRVSPDGKERFGGTVGYALTGVAAGKDGTVATSEAHFSHRVAFWGRDFSPLGHVPDFPRQRHRAMERPVGSRSRHSTAISTASISTGCGSCASGPPTSWSPVIRWNASANRAAEELSPSAFPNRANASSPPGRAE